LGPQPNEGSEVRFVDKPRHRGPKGLVLPRRLDEPPGLLNRHPEIPFWRFGRLLDGHATCYFSLERDPMAVKVAGGEVDGQPVKGYLVSTH
jgi:hypothetical protein